MSENQYDHIQSLSISEIRDYLMSTPESNINIVSVLFALCDKMPQIQRKPMQQPQPAPVTLVDAVETYGHTPLNDTKACGLAWRNVELALTAERKRQEIIDTMITDVRFAINNGILGKNCVLANDLQALDAFDKERGA